MSRGLAEVIQVQEIWTENVKTQGQRIEGFLRRQDRIREDIASLQQAFEKYRHALHEVDSNASAEIEKLKERNATLVERLDYLSETDGLVEDVAARQDRLHTFIEEIGKINKDDIKGLRRTYEALSEKLRAVDDQQDKRASRLESDLAEFSRQASTRQQNLEQVADQLKSAVSSLSENLDTYYSQAQARVDDMQTFIVKAAADAKARQAMPPVMPAIPQAPEAATPEAQPSGPSVDVAALIAEQQRLQAIFRSRIAPQNDGLRFPSNLGL